MVPTNSAHGATWDLGILYDNPDDPKIAADPRLTSVLPTTRLSTEGVAARAPDLPSEGANLVEQPMTNTVYSTFSRPRAALITNGIVGDIIFGNQHPKKASKPSPTASQLRTQKPRNTLRP